MLICFFNFFFTSLCRLENTLCVNTHFSKLKINFRIVSQTSCIQIANLHSKLTFSFCFNIDSNIWAYENLQNKEINNNKKLVLLSLWLHEINYSFIRLLLKPTNKFKVKKKPRKVPNSYALNIPQKNTNHYIKVSFKINHYK